MKSFVLLSLSLFCLAHTLVFSQKADVPEAKSAIHFEENLRWQEILEKAKKESKYIFLDCFTTWCGPCKRLEKEVYIIDSVGSFFNENFISVKMQMDKTKADPETVKARYQDASLIEKKHEIDAYPTLIFFNPNGEIVNREAGYFAPANLLNIARVALQPGRLYNDPVAELKRSIKAVQAKGAAVSDFNPLIEKALALGKNQLVDSLSEAYMLFLRKQPLANLYQKDMLLTIGSSKLAANDPLMKLFYPDNKKADAIVGKGFSKLVIDRYIKNTYFENTKFFKKNIPTATWDSMQHMIAQQFSGDFAPRAVSAAKAEWYGRNMEKVLFPQQVLSLIERHGLESVLIYDFLLGTVSRFEDSRKISALIANAICWDFIFKLPENEHLLDRGINCMRTVVRDGENDNTAWWNTQTFDTYANLLYKRGRVKEAMEYQQKALDLLKALPNAPQDMIAFYESSLKKMKEGIPTWSVNKQKG